RPTPPKKAASAFTTHNSPSLVGLSPHTPVRGPSKFNPVHWVLGTEYFAAPAPTAGSCSRPGSTCRAPEIGKRQPFMLNWHHVPRATETAGAPDRGMEAGRGTRSAQTAVT